MKKKVFEFDVRGGEPVFPNTKIPISCLFEAMKAGGFVDNFIEIYPTVTKKQVVALLEAAEESLLAYKDTSLTHRENEEIVALRQSLASVTEALVYTIADRSNHKAPPEEGATPERTIN